MMENYLELYIMKTVFPSFGPPVQKVAYHCCKVVLGHPMKACGLSGVSATLLTLDTR
jgi:3-oxoacyl-(acyl-carrier-protein) synthase